MPIVFIFTKQNGELRIASYLVIHEVLARSWTPCCGPTDMVILCWGQVVAWRPYCRGISALGTVPPWASKVNTEESMENHRIWWTKWDGPSLPPIYPCPKWTEVWPHMGVIDTNSTVYLFSECGSQFVLVIDFVTWTLWLVAEVCEVRSQASNVTFARTH